MFSLGVGVGWETGCLDWLVFLGNTSGCRKVSSKKLSAEVAGLSRHTEAQNYTTSYADVLLSQVPIFIPIIVLMAAVYLVLAPIIDQPQMEILYIILFIFSGIIFYFPLVHFKYHPHFLRRVTLHLQLLLEVAPTTRDENWDNILPSRGCLHLMVIPSTLVFKAQKIFFCSILQKSNE